MDIRCLQDGREYCNRRVYRSSLFRIQLLHPRLPHLPTSLQESSLVLILHGDEVLRTFLRPKLLPSRVWFCSVISDRGRGGDDHRLISGRDGVQCSQDDDRVSTPQTYSRFSFTYLGRVSNSLQCHEPTRTRYIPESLQTNDRPPFSPYDRHRGSRLNNHYLFVPLSGTGHNERNHIRPNRRSSSGSRSCTAHVISAGRRRVRGSLPGPSVWYARNIHLQLSHQETNAFLPLRRTKQHPGQKPTRHFLKTVS